MNKYVVFNEQTEPCNSMLMHESVILYLSQVPAI